MRIHCGHFTGIRLIDVNGNLVVDKNFENKGTWVVKEISPSQDIIGLTVNRSNG